MYAAVWLIPRKYGNQLSVYKQPYSPAASVTKICTCIAKLAEYVVTLHQTIDSTARSDHSGFQLLTNSSHFVTAPIFKCARVLSME